MQRVLSFEQAPPISIPLRYFLSAPLFAVAAGLLLMWSGSDALASRWSPITLSLTHLLTLGFLSMTMAGALFQMLPVVAGADVPAVRMTAGVVHLFLTMGTIVLCTGFWRMNPVLFKTAIVFLLIAFLWLLATALYAVIATRGKNDTLAAIRLALASLVVTVSLGVGLASVLAWSLDVPFSLLVRLHVTWGLIGWVSLLIIGVAFQVVPMFQVTPVYPLPISRWLTRSLFVLLGLWSAAVIFVPNAPSWYGSLLSICIAAGLATFSLATFYLLWKRKRPITDPTTFFWRI
ncbi:MAG: permease, partial [Burkholderiaceae bacterium]